MKCPYAKKQEHICSECHNSIFYYTECRKSVTEPMTNEEWFDDLSTEEKAGFISAVLDYGFGIDYKPINPMGEDVHTKEDIERWLKEKHDEM